MIQQKSARRIMKQVFTLSPWWDGGSSENPLYTGSLLRTPCASFISLFHAVRGEEPSSKHTHLERVSGLGFKIYSRHWYGPVAREQLSSLWTVSSFDAQYSRYRGSLRFLLVRPLIQRVSYPKPRTVAVPGLQQRFPKP